MTFPRFDLATHPETIQSAREAFALAGLANPIGGGTRAYFTELNRATDFLPVDRLDAITYTINPQVHATDNLSVIETLTAQAETVRSARQIVGDKPLIVGPVTWQPPWNPNATGPAPEPPPGHLPPEVDARQLSLLGAGWTVGSIHQLAAGGADALTFYELYGWRGVIERQYDLTCRDRFPSEPGQLFPLYHVFASVAEFAGGSIAQVALSAPFEAEALAMRIENRVRVLVASFAEQKTDILVTIPGLSDPRVIMLDETTWDEAAGDPDFLRRGTGQPLSFVEDAAVISFRPFGVACIEGVLNG